jgi:hypothetical protein
MNRVSLLIAVRMGRKEELKRADLHLPSEFGMCHVHVLVPKINIV